MWPTALECSGAPWRFLKPNRTGIEYFSADVIENPSKAMRFFSQAQINSTRLDHTQRDRVETKSTIERVSPTISLSLECRFLDQRQNLFRVCAVYVSKSQSSQLHVQSLGSSGLSV